VKQVGELEIPLPLYNIYLHETDELVRLLAQDFGEWRHEPRPVNPQALQAAHTLAGTSGTVGFTALRELALALEATLEALLPPAPIWIRCSMICWTLR
jgi:chemosensory pili system protein ChpA (sensor histidine kinase/response regulator)